MKKVILLALLAIFSTATFAQIKGTKKLSLGAEFAIPTEDFINGADLGFGASVKYQKAFADKLYYTVGLGYLTFNSERALMGSNLNYNLQYIPVKLGFKYFLLNNFYAAGELGATFQTGDGNNNTYFAYSPGLGIEFPVSKDGSVDVGVRYEGWVGSRNVGLNNSQTDNFPTVTLSTIAFRIAYNFSL